MGYSIDDQVATIEPTSFSAVATASLGSHILHVKCWGQNTSAETLLNITVVPPTNIAVQTPANGAQVTSPFNVAANVTMCGGVPAVSMGYSIDSQVATIEPTSFNATATASVGNHTLHVKCWGQNTGAETLLNITVQPPPVSNIAVQTPANGAQVTSPFNVAANVTTCGGVPAVSMGYSIDSQAAMIEPTSFNATATASVGPHTLHVKCWGQNTGAETLVSITVVQPPPVSNIAVQTPANGAQVTSPFNVAANVTTCGGVPAVSMGYSIDSQAVTIEPTSFSALATASVGLHTLHVKCWGQNTGAETLLNITVIQPPAATPLAFPAAGTYQAAQTVTLSTATPGATIYYTTDGSAPSAAALPYAGPIAVSKSATIQAIAAAPGYLNSGMARADYVITPPPAGPSIPSNAISSKQLQVKPNWTIVHDAGTPGTSNGSMLLVGDPSLSGEAAQFTTTFSYWGGERYSEGYDNDTNAMNFVYDAQVWVQEGSVIGNLELDNNQVLANGDTVIYGFQCAGDTNSWDYTQNAGTPQSPNIQWVQSNQPCDPEQWTPNAWHHVQISYSRDSVGNVTYKSVWLDGVEAPINATVLSAFTLGWDTGILLTNFQVDGKGAGGGSSTLYVDNMTIYRW